MEQAQDLRDIFLRLCQAVSEGDLVAFDEITSRREPIIFIGTDPEEWWQDADEIRDALRQQASVGISLIPGDVVAYREGTVGWVADRGYFRLADGGEVPTRLTAVFHQEDGDWKLVQGHASIGVSNVEALGQDFAS